jgi:hypothetical protein
MNTSVKCCVVEIPEPNPQLSYLNQVKEIALQLEKLHTLLLGTAWIWVKDFIWQPTPNWDLGKDYEQRYHYKRSLGLGTERKDGSSYNLEADKYGGIAEDYIARMLGCEADRKLYKSGDGKFDFYFNGRKIDVKWLSYSGDRPYLKINPGNNLADIYVVTQGKEIKILGWVSKEQVDRAELIEWGYGKHLSIPAQEFQPFTDLIAESTSLRPSEYALYPEHIGLVIRRSKFYLQRIKQSVGKYVIFCVGKKPIKEISITPYAMSDCWDISQANPLENISSWEGLVRW